MATQEAVERRRANRKAARAAKAISKKLRDIDGPTLAAALETSSEKKQDNNHRAKHDKAWGQFQRRRGAHPRFAHLAADKRVWEAWVALIDLRDERRREWWFSTDTSDDTRWMLCKEGREIRASSRRFRLAKLTMRQRYDAIQKGRKFDLN